MIFGWKGTNLLSREIWYKNVNVLFEIVHQLKNREVMFIPYRDKKAKRPIRWLKASAIKFLLWHFEKYDFVPQEMNLYHSLAVYDHMPTFSYNWLKKSQQQKIWLKKFKDYLLSYDLFIETDSDDLDKSIKEDGVRIKRLLDDFTMVYSLNYSGRRGLHYTIPHSEFEFLNLKLYDDKLQSNIFNFKKLLQKLPLTLKDLRNKFDLVWLFKALVLRFSGIYGLDTVDTSVSDIKRVKKVAYSWDVKSNLICYPLSDYQLEHFNTDIVRPENVINNVYKRGLLYRNVDVPVKTRQKNILRLLHELDMVKEKDLNKRLV